ncbi:MAG: hypothetical protein BWK79_11225 [Beggiatoa sp. IS2]|nr:MAG: hypothetical protein BWK79_11225 [Beggiatoa sp. IS2]
MTLQKDIKLKYLAMPIAYHVKHSTNWDNTNYVRLGLHFSEFLNPPTLSTQLRALLKENPNQFLKSLGSISVQVRSYLFMDIDKVKWVGYSLANVEKIR